MAILLSDTVWEGTAAERLTYGHAQGVREGHVWKDLDAGESYIFRSGSWQGINKGFSFIAATKSGRGITNVSGDWSIVFATPFIDDQYSIALSSEDPGGPPMFGVFFHSRNAAGFSVKSRLFSGAPKGNVNFSWLVTRDYDPAVL